MKYNTIIFDLDGTLLNTIEDLTDAVNVTMRKFSYKEHTVEEVKSFVGNGMKNLIKNALYGETDEEKIKKAFDFYKEYYSRNSNIKTKPYEGIFDLLSILKEKGIKMAIVSNKNHNSVLDLMHLYFKDYIEFAFGDMEGEKRKPHPDLLLKAMNELGGDINNTLFVGDSEVDLLTAQNANILPVLVTWGFRDREFLYLMGAREFIDSPMELLNLIK